MTDLPLWRRVIVWTLAPLVNNYHGLSLTRLVVVCGVVRIYDVHENLADISWPEVTLWAILLLGSIAKDARDLVGGFRAIWGRRSSDAMQPPES